MKYETKAQAALDVSTNLAAHVAAADPHTQYILAAGDTMTGTLNTRALIPTLTGTYDLGTTSLRYKDFLGQRLKCHVAAETGTGTTVTIRTLANASVYSGGGGSGIRNITVGEPTNFTGTSFGGVFSDLSASSTGNHDATGDNCFATGLAALYNCFPGTVVNHGAIGNQSFCSGVASSISNTAGANAITLRAEGMASFVSGTVENNDGGAGFNSFCTLSMRATGRGAAVIGYMTSLLDFAVATMDASGRGAVITGYSTAGNMLASGNGARVSGTLQAAGNMTASGSGSVAEGAGLFGNIRALADGAMARGVTGGGFRILASGLGSVASGDSTAGAIDATAANAVQFGPGVNAQPDCLKVGNAGIRFRGLVVPVAALPAGAANGDLWVDAAGAICMLSAGVLCVATLPVM